MVNKSIENSSGIVPVLNIQSMIFTVRGVQVMVDRDLASVYGVESKRLNEQVKRNISRFPEAFRFQVSDQEKEELVANCDRFESLKHSTSNPYVFTEQGVSMLSAVLRSDTAVKVSIQIINAFVEMRRFLQQNASVFARLDLVERRQITFESETEKNFEKVFQALEAGEPPKQGIFYDGQVYDAYSFVADLIRKAKKSLTLVDNYVDDSVLTLLSKRKKGVTATIHTQTISKQLALDLKKHNEQYSPITIKTFKDAHDRFLIIDEKEIYHIGASLKDLGKKWFAFSRFESGTVEMLRKLGGGK
ncbi:ORF6N domain-containing protein [Prosthecochloris sp. CIB 2401]|uniref:ORF6N domain-containing protein n=1 Tax=Prosthecochloris sp. CIB 2401 TaxID=1868325 RepID=UPI00080A9522|nr:ORF6N domain-containing protein [Prosthecochloris sp. CIB 2401]ANT65979.1 ORF6N domain protein [Prosthecochloris sp. CIB 2401]